MIYEICVFTFVSQTVKMCLGAESHKPALVAAKILVAGKYERSIPCLLDAAEKR